MAVCVHHQLVPVWCWLEGFLGCRENLVGWRVWNTLANLATNFTNFLTNCAMIMPARLCVSTYIHIFTCNNVPQGHIASIFGGSYSCLKGWGRGMPMLFSIPEMSHAIQILIQRGTLSDVIPTVNVTNSIVDYCCWHAELLIESPPMTFWGIVIPCITWAYMYS